jgi:hypothetical protein
MIWLQLNNDTGIARDYKYNFCYRVTGEEIETLVSNSYKDFRFQERVHESKKTILLTSKEK